jgi:hypothetical protein
LETFNNGERGEYIDISITNALYHLVGEHSSESTSLSIPEHNTVNWRKPKNIPDSDVFGLEKTRKRSDIVSTSHCDSNDQKRKRSEKIKVEILLQWSMQQNMLNFTDLNQSYLCPITP